MNEKTDSSRFTIQGGEAEPDSIYISDAENLRIEKLSTRVTLVAVLIPCLLVVVLIVAYLDIKNRVVNTQNTGSMGVQNLSKDLESRFSNLSLKQAKIDAQLTKDSNAQETANAAMQVNLKKITTELKQIADNKLDQSSLTAMSQKTEAAMAGMRKVIEELKSEMADLNATFSRFDEELAAQISVMAEGLKKDQGRLAEIEKNYQRLDSEKLSKDSMDLAMGLERIGIQEMVKDNIRAMEKKLAAISKQMDTLNKRLNAQAKQASPKPSTAAVYKPSAPPEPAPDNDSGSTTIVEQTID